MNKSFRQFQPFSAPIVNAHGTKANGVISVGIVQQLAANITIGGYEIIYNGIVVREPDMVTVTPVSGDKYICVVNIDSASGTTPSVISSYYPQGITLLTKSEDGNWISASIDSGEVIDHMNFARTTDFEALIGPGKIGNVKLESTIKVDLDNSAEIRDFELQVVDNIPKAVGCKAGLSTAPRLGAVIGPPYTVWATCDIPDTDGVEGASGVFVCDDSTSPTDIEVYEDEINTSDATIVSTGNIDAVAVAKDNINGEDLTIAIAHSTNTLDIYSYTRKPTSAATKIMTLTVAAAIERMDFIDYKSLVYTLVGGGVYEITLTADPTASAPITHKATIVNAWPTHVWHDIDGTDVLTKDATTGIYINGVKKTDVAASTDVAFLCNGNLYILEADTTISFMGRSFSQTDTGSRTMDTYRKIILPNGNVLFVFNGLPDTLGSRQATFLCVDPKSGDILYHYSDATSGTVDGSARIYNGAVCTYEDQDPSKSFSLSQNTSSLLNFGIFHNTLPSIKLPVSSVLSASGDSTASGYRYRRKEIELTHSAFGEKILIDGNTKVKGVKGMVVSDIYLGALANDISLAASVVNAGLGNLTSAEVSTNLSNSTSIDRVCDGDAVYASGTPGSTYQVGAADSGVLVLHGVAGLTFDKYLAGNIDIDGGVYDNMHINGIDCTISNATIDILNLINCRNVVFINCNIVSTINDSDATNNTYTFLGCSGVAPGAGAFVLDAGVVKETSTVYTNDFVFGSSVLINPTVAAEYRRFGFDESLGNFFAGYDTGTWNRCTGSYNAIFGSEVTTNNGNYNVIGGYGNDITGDNNLVVGAFIEFTGNYNIVNGDNSSLGTGLLNNIIVTDGSIGNGHQNNIYNLDGCTFTGTNCENNIVVGTRHTLGSYSDGNAVFGDDHTTGSALTQSIIAGRGHTEGSTSEYNAIFGSSNSSGLGDCNNNILAGSANVVSGESFRYNAMFGYDNTVADNTNQYNLIAGTAHAFIGACSANFVSGSGSTLNASGGSCAIGYNHTISSSSYTNVSGNGNSVSNYSRYNLVGGNANILNQSEYNLAVGKSNSITLSSSYNIVGGSDHNITYSSYDAISGNDHTINLAEYSIIGGYNNTVGGDYSIIGGGNNNVTAHYAGVFGSTNTVSGLGSVVAGSTNSVAGQRGLTVGLSHLNNLDYCTLLGDDHTATTTLPGKTIANATVLGHEGYAMWDSALHIATSRAHGTSGSGQSIIATLIGGSDDTTTTYVTNQCCPRNSTTYGLELPNNTIAYVKLRAIGCGDNIGLNYSVMIELDYLVYVSGAGTVNASERNRTVHYQGSSTTGAAVRIPATESGNLLKVYCRGASSGDFINWTVTAEATIEEVAV